MTSQNVPVKIETKQYGLSRTNKDNDSQSTIEGYHFEKIEQNFMIYIFFIRFSNSNKRKSKSNGDLFYYLSYVNINK